MTKLYGKLQEIQYTMGREKEKEEGGLGWGFGNFEI